MNDERRPPVRRLSGLDSAFLYLECKEIPLNVAAVLIFDRPIPFQEFVVNLDSRLHLLPRFRQVVVRPPLNVGYPVWEDDPRFDIHNHIKQIRLPKPGGDAELEEVAGRILSQVMDRARPLWDMHVVHGVQNGRGALILRLHHSLADGIAGISLLNIIFDGTAEAVPASAPSVRRARQPRQPSLAASLVSGIRSSLQHLIDAEAGIVDFAQALLEDQTGVKEAAPLLPEVAGSVERLPFNRPCSGDRKFCWTELDLGEIKAVRNKTDASVNDVILSILTRAVSRYTVLHGETVTNRLFRVVCPVNLRQDTGESMGNRISFLPVALPLDMEDPVRMMEAVAVRTAAMKKARAADFVAFVANCFGVTPPFVQAMLWRGISGVILPVPLLNMIFTNVAGSKEPQYCLGRKMLAIYPQVPTGYELGINCAVYSYCGKVFFGLIADAHVAEDVGRLRDFLLACFDELCVATGVRKPVRKTKAARTVRPHRKPPARRKAEQRPAEPAVRESAPEPSPDPPPDPPHHVRPESLAEAAALPQAMATGAGAD